MEFGESQSRVKSFWMDPANEGVFQQPLPALLWGKILNKNGLHN